MADVGWNFPLFSLKASLRRIKKVHKKEHEYLSLKILSLKSWQMFNNLFQNVIEDVQILLVK